MNRIHKDLEKQDMNKDFEEKFKIKELTLYESEYWIISLRPQQSTLGSLVLSAKRDCVVLSELTNEETEELSTVFKLIETKLKQTFEYDKINYLALMMIDNHVHFHIIPRYATPKIFCGREYVDKTWPTPPDILLNIVDTKALSNLYDELKRQFYASEN